LRDAKESVNFCEKVFFKFNKILSKAVKLSVKIYCSLRLPLFFLFRFEQNCFFLLKRKGRILRIDSIF
jgi:hypothetical protein